LGRPACTSRCTGEGESLFALIHCGPSLPELVEGATGKFRRKACRFLNSVRQGAGPAPPLYYQKTQPMLKIRASLRLPVVVVQHPAELLFAADAARFGQKLRRVDELFLDPLMIAPLAIVSDEDREGGSEVGLT